MKTKLTLSLLLMVFFGLYGYGQTTILSGPEQGAYYEFVNDIISVAQDSNATLYSNMATEGAAENFKMLLDPSTDIKVGFMQMDYLFMMQAMDAQNNTEKTKSLKVLVPMAREEIHFVTKKSSGIKTLEDLKKGGLVDIGNMNQGTYSTAYYINERSGINFLQKNYHFDEALKNLMLNNVQVFAFVGTAPVKKLDFDPRGLKEEITLIELNDINGWAQYYRRDTIRKTDYRWLEADVPTYGVRAVLIVNEAKVNDEDLEKLKHLVNSIRSNKSKLEEKGHPKWKNIDLDGWNKELWPIIDL